MSPYVPVSWVDDVTALDAAHMNHMEDTIEVLDLAGRTGGDLTVTGGAITVTHGFHRIVANPAAGVLTTINGGADGRLVYLTNYTGALLYIDSDHLGNIQATGPALFSVMGTREFIFNAIDGLWMYAAE